jgi:hypothetical protein
MRHYQARPALSRALLKESLFAEGEWAARFGAQAQATHQAVAAFLKRAQDAGAVDATLDVAVAAGAWLAFFYFALIGWVQGQLVDPLSFIRTLTKQHLRQEQNLEKEAP